MISLAKEVGRILRLKREAAHLTQKELAAQLGLTQQRLSQVERGESAPTTTAIEQLFRGLGLQVKIATEPLNSDLDNMIATAAPKLEQTRLFFVSSLLWMCEWSGAELPGHLDGQLAAAFHGVPLRVDRVDLAVAKDNLDGLAKWMGRTTWARYDERWDEFDDYEADPRTPHRPLWWRGAHFELKVRLVDDLTAPIVVQVNDSLSMPIRPLLEVMEHEPIVAMVQERLKAAGQSV